MIPNSNILETIVSIVLIYALLSIMVSVLIEWWQHYQKTRSKFLKRAIYQLLNDPLNLDFGTLFYSHYQVDGMKNKFMKRPPAYISSTVFAQVLMDIIASHCRNTVAVRLKVPINDAGKQYELGNIKAPEGSPRKSPFELGLEALHPSPFSETINSFWERADKDQHKMLDLLARWYDDYMDRVGGWFKTEQRRTFRAFGFIVALALNADSLHLIKMISIDEGLRSNLVTTADKVSDQYTALSDSLKTNSAALLRTFNSVPVDTSVQLVPTKDPEAMNRLARTLQLNDSLGRVSMQRADSVMGIVAALNIPLGWDRDSAPVSWYYHWKEFGKETAGSSGIIAYQTDRNTPSVGTILMYLLGMFITGFMLSFGAPFWFETLVKVINIRRAGIKPPATNTKS